MIVHKNACGSLRVINRADRTHYDKAIDVLEGALAIGLFKSENDVDRISDALRTLKKAN